MNVQIVFPVGAWGASEADDALDTLLREIAVKASPDPRMEWAEKYGTDCDNDVFMMHHYCWCEREDCPWCGGCDCPPSAFHYYIDGQEVSYKQWDALYRDNVPPYTEKGWEQVSAAINRRRTEKHDAVCDYCTGKGVFATNGAEPRMGAPNFWHKASGLKVWWYKYIGRDSHEMGPEITPELLAQVRESCLAVLSK